MMLVAWPGGSWESTVAVVVTVIGLYVALMWMALVFWTVRDIHQRSRSAATQISAGLLVLFFFLPGHWLYLVLRPRVTLAERYERTLEAEAVLLELSERAACPRCARRVRDDFVHCPSCRAQLKRACDECRRPLDFAWVICPGCGAETPNGAKRAAARRRGDEAAAVAATVEALRGSRASAVVPHTAPLPRPVPRNRNGNGHSNGNGNGHNNGNGHLKDLANGAHRS